MRYVNWKSVPVFKEWNSRFTIPKGEVPDFTVPWYYYMGAVVISLVIGVGFSLAGMYFFGG